MEEYQLRLQAFEGPFDLLLHLIRENQVDIYDIPIAEITAQYMDYLAAMEELDLEIASSFLVMAATLLAIKAKMLLPAPPADDDEEPEDARGELVRDLLEYIQFKQAAEAIDLLAAAQSRRFARPNEQELFVNLFSDENPLAGKTLVDLQNAFALVLKKAEAKGRVLRIEREQVTLKEKLELLYRLIAEHPGGIAFSDAFAADASRMSLIVTFLALLELARMGVLRISQGGAFDEIYLYAGDLRNFEHEDVEHGEFEQ